MIRCSVCNKDMQQRSYNKHFTSKRHMRVLLAEDNTEMGRRHIKLVAKRKTFDDKIEAQRVEREAEFERETDRLDEEWRRKCRARQLCKSQPYTLLDLSAGCTLLELKKAYKRAALRAHPDKEGGRVVATRRSEP
jgi:hypothetical protein